MSGRGVYSVSRGRIARAVIAVMITVPSMLALASSNTGRAATSRDEQAVIANNAPVDLPYAQVQGPDLCELLKQVAGSEPVNQAPGVGKPGADYQCTMAMRNGAYMTLTNFGVEQARVHVDLEKSRSGGWVANALGDAGYGFESPAHESPDPYLGWSAIYLIYARGCYFVQASGGKDPDTRKPADQPAIPAIASALDSALQQPPYSACGGTPQPGLDLTIDHIEVVQVVQTVGNDIKLVAGKKTVVRVFPRASGTALGGVASNVEASLFFWPEGGEEIELKPTGNWSVNLIPGAEPEREKTEGSINFVITPEMAASGPFSLRVVVNPERVIEEKSYGNNEIVEPFEFVQRNGLRVGYVRIGYKPPSQSTFSWPTSDLSKYDVMLRKLLPASEAGVEYYELPWRVRHTRSSSTVDMGGDLLLYLREFREQMKSDKPDVLVGWLDSQYSTGFEYGGLAEGTPAGLSGSVAIALDYHSAESAAILAHEVGHNLDLDHTGTTRDPNPPCQLSSNSNSNYWPKEYNNSAAIREPGFDTVEMKVIPSSYYDIMSYCGTNRWITPFHYRHLFDQNVKPAQQYKGGTVGDIITRGWGWVRGGGGAPRFELVRPTDDNSGGNASPALSRSSRAVGGFGLDFADSLLFAGAQKRVAFQSEGTGNYCLRFLDANGGALYERCFEPSFVDQETLEPIEETGFVLSVPDPGDFVRVALIQKEGGAEREITAIEASAPPAVTITSPKAGDRWEGEHTIEWSGTDADGDELRYDIQYSPDGKKTWYPLEVRSYETSYTFSTDEILPSDQTYIRVMASDGFDTSHADVGPLVV
ncbi:MAG: M12 family metallo-peptidase, partial [Chloroflexia bacterium]